MRILKTAPVFVLCLALLAGCADIEEQDSASDLPAAKAETTAKSEPSPVTPDPDGKYELDCDYSLGDFESDDPAAGYRFIAGGTLENTGNVGIRIRVTYRWRLLGQDALTERRTYRVGIERSREINVTMPATQDQIGAHQSADAKCSAKATIVDTYGQAAG